jgi:hypothetical protein
VLQIDADGLGGGAGFVTLVTLTGQAGLTLGDMLANGNLETAAIT